MAIYFRRDDWVTSALGNAISGAKVYVTSQPTNQGYVNEDGVYVPPSPLVPLYADPYGVKTQSNPALSDGFGHAFYYVASGTYTVTIWSPQIGQVTLSDQVISAPTAPVTAGPPSGNQDGVNRVFTLISTPSNWSLVFRNGILQNPSVDYSLSGATITFTTAPLVGDQLFAVFQ